MKKLFEVVAVVGVTAILFAGCAGTESAAQNNSEATQETEIEESIMDPETLNQSVQDTLTYEGGLYVNGNPDSDMELAIFKNEEGESICARLLMMILSRSRCIATIPERIRVMARH